MKKLILIYIVILTISVLNSDLCESENFVLQRDGMLQGYSNTVNNSFSDEFELKVFVGYELGIEVLCSEQFILNTGFYEFESLIVNVENDVINDSHIIIQNHPNPFNPSTSIFFSIPDNSNIELLIYNLKGQKVKTLIEEQMPKGSHSIIWEGDNESGKNVSSGIYYYKLNVNGNTASVKKCLLLK